MQSPDVLGSIISVQWKLIVAAELHMHVTLEASE
jgi:hypothetical protein